MFSASVGASFLSSEVESQYEKTKDEISENEDANKKRNHGVMSHDKSRVDNDQTRRLRERVDQT